LTLDLLDTNIISDLIKNPQGKATQRIVEVGEDKICTSIIVASKLRYACAKNGSKRLIDQGRGGTRGRTHRAAIRCPRGFGIWRLSGQAEAAGRPIGGNDLLIAAQACSIEAIVVTANTSEFKRVRGLKVENWLA
jgi:tRNA(fMet)-specific endonuclease VapC